MIFVSIAFYSVLFVLAAAAIYIIVNVDEWRRERAWQDSPREPNESSDK